jgi:PAS domain S-box-containing protein
MRTKLKTTGKRNSTKAGRASTSRRSTTKTQRAKDTLIANEERLRNIFDSVPVSIWEEDFSEVCKALDELRSQGVIDLRAFLNEHPEFVRTVADKVKVIDVNEMTLHLFEAKDKKELLGSLEKFLVPEALPAFRDELIAIAEGKPFFEGEVADRTLQGRPLRLWRTIVFPKEDAKFNSVLVSLTDITESKRAETVVQESEKRYRTIFQTSGVSIWEEDFSEVKKALDALKAQGVSDFRSYLKGHPEFVKAAMKQLTVIDVNEMSLKLYEAKDKDELLGSKDKTFGPETLVAFSEELNALAQGASFFEGEVIDQTLKGKRLHLWRTIVFPKEEADYKSVLVCLTDITERKRAENALRESEARLLTVLEASPIPITLNSVEDGVILYGNSALADLLRMTPAEIIGHRAVDFYVDPNDRLMILAELEKQDSIRDQEVRLRRRDNSFLWVSLSTEKIMLDGQVCLLSSFYDITERKQTEQALRLNEQRLRQIIDLVPHFIFAKDVDGKYILVNQAVVDAYGTTVEELTGKTDADFANIEEEIVRFRADDLDVINSGKPKHIPEEPITDVDGVTRILNTTKIPFTFSGTSIPAVLGVSVDITERKQAETLQKAIYQISEAANKSSNLDDIFRSVHAIIGHVMRANNFYIALFDSENNLISFPYYVDEVEGMLSIPAGKPEHGMTEYVLRTGRPLLSDQANFDELVRAGEVKLVGTPSPIWIGVPLIVEGRTIGVIALQDYHNPKAYTERELRILEYVSGQVAKAIERTRLYADVQRNNRILSALQDATLPLIKQTELSEVLQEILKQATELFETTDGYIYLVKPDESEIVLSMGIGPSCLYIGTRLKIGEGLAGKVWETGEPLSVDNYDTWSGRSSIFDATIFHASAAVPLMTKSNIMGVLGIGYVIPERKFNHDDLELLTRFAELASIAIENARLYTIGQQELNERKIAEEALIKAEAKYRELVERLPVVVYTSELGASGIWHYISPQIESLLGFTPEEWISNPNIWYQQIHPEDRDIQQALEDQTYTSGAKAFDAQYRINARDGREIWVRDTAYILPAQEGKPPIVQGVLMDITQRKQAETLQSAIYQISDAVYSSSNMDDFYRAIQRSLQSVMNADNFFIALYNKETDLLSFPYYVDERDPIPNTAPLGRGPTGYVIRHGVPLLGRSDTMQKLEEEGELIPAGSRSIDWLGVPLKINNETIGVMAVQTYAEGIRYTQRDLDILNFVSTQVALSIERKQAGETVRAAEARYRTLVEQLPIVVYVNPADNVDSTVYVSPQIKDFLGYTYEEWLKDPIFWKKALHPEDRPRVLAEVEKMRRESDYFDEEYRMIARDGSIVWVRDQATLLHDAEGRPLLWQGLMVDISERKQRDEQIRRQVERLKALRTIDMFIAGGTDLHLTMQTILNQAVAQLRVDAADILLLNPSMHVLEFAEGIGFHTRAIQHVLLRVGESFAGRVVLERETITHRDATVIASQPALAEEGFAHYFGVPLIAKGEVKGVLEVFHRSQQDVDSEWMDFLESLAGQAALAIDNASLFDSLQRSNLELGMAYETTLEGWSAALDLRDKETEGHTQRVTNLTLKLAEAMKLGERERVHMRRGALLHDIGKMGIPDRILLKPDQLTEEEWEIMRQHPTYAYNLLSPISYLRPALDIPYCHHEKWDGTGYPRKLKGEAIPLSARIFAVADVWDALCSDRPYRPAWTKEKALEHIKSLSGIHFDPRVVEVFLQVVDQS